MPGKRRNGKDHNSDCVLVHVDRISALPDPVIYLILSFVPTVYAVRMSVLSRRWSRVWHSLPTLHFPHLTGFTAEGAFDLFTDKCLKHRRRAMRFVADSSVTTLKLEICSSPERLASLNKWFHSSVVMNNVKELDLCFRGCGYLKSYSLPSAVLNRRCLTHLKLGDRVKISKSCSVNLPSLKSLFLVKVCITRKTLYNLVLGCCSLEKCVLVVLYCRDDLRISSNSLKFLDVESGYEIQEAIFKAANLQTLVLRCAGHYPYDFGALTRIKNLVLEEFCCTQIEGFEDLMTELTVLEHLTLKVHEEEVDALTMFEMKIPNQTLKHMSFCKKAEVGFTLTIESWNLDSFTYQGDTNFSMSIHKHHVTGKFYLWKDSINNTSWDTQLMAFLSNSINCNWTSVGLYIDNDKFRFFDIEVAIVKDLIVPKKLTTLNPPWLHLKHLKVTVQEASTRKAQLRRSLKLLFPSLETLSIENDYKHYDPNYRKIFSCQFLSYD